MLFNSYSFVFIFLPIVIIGYYTLGHLKLDRFCITWLIGASLFFYGWWNPKYVFLIVLSVIINYLFGNVISRSGNPNKKILLVFGIILNLGALIFFKYSNFLVININYLTTSSYHLKKIILPLAISFFTFQQIAYLVECFKGEVQTHRIQDYCLFVTFFPQLIAGPIVGHGEMLPQYRKKIIQVSLDGFSLGLSFFVIGLFKKVIIADTIARYSTPVFEAALSGEPLVTFFSAWGGALSYTFQLYYDFSGYSDMAIGLALFFGFRLPLNFFSPYKATSIIEFWKRWHITLSRFLQRYLYFPMGGNRKGKIRKYIHLFVTMLLGGIWHGAGWTFVLWGAIHGCLLIINHAWRSIKLFFGFHTYSETKLVLWISRLLTFFVVVIAWVFFRADSVSAAIEMLKGMSGLNGFILPYRLGSMLGPLRAPIENVGVKFMYDSVFGQWGYPYIFGLLILTWAMPNTRQLFGKFKPTVNEYKGEYPYKKKHQPWFGFNRTVAILLATITVLAVAGMNEVSEFLYFQF